MALDIITSINLDMKAPNAEIVYGNQYDSAGHVRAQLLNDGEKWLVPSGAKAVVSYRKSDNIGGYYDTTELGETAVSIESDRSIISIALDVQTMTTLGRVYVQVSFVQYNKRLSTFSFLLQVMQSPIVASNIESKWFVHLLSLSGIVVDDTLSRSGLAADAKTTGDRLSAFNTLVGNEENRAKEAEDDLLGSINNEIQRATTNENLKVNKPTISPNGTAGQLLRTNGDGSTTWVDEGLPTDEQTEAALSDWFDTHPEYWASVQDGSLSEVKFTDHLKVLTIKDWLTPQMFGAVGDGVTDDTAAIQACLDAVKPGGAIFFPHLAGTGALHYKITSTLYLRKNYVTLFSSPPDEYTEGIITDQPITMLMVIAAGVTIQNLYFRGSGTALAWGTQDAIVFDRRSLGDSEYYSNLDETVFNCGFLYIKDCIKGYGRNVNVQNCIFSNSKRGVVGYQHTYNGGTESEFRGWRVFNCRFHSMGNPYNQTKEAIGEGNYPTSLETVDSWCIEMPCDATSVGNLEVIANLADLTFAGFYKGYLVGSRIIENHLYRGSALLIYSPITKTDLINISSSYVSVVSNNIVNNASGNVGSTARDGARAHEVMNRHFIYVSGCNQLSINNNVFRGAGEEGIIINNSYRASFEFNKIILTNMFYGQDSIKRSVVKAYNTSRGMYKHNYVDSTLGGNPYDYIFNIENSTQLGISDNLIFIPATKYNVNAAQLYTDDNALAWQIPEMENDYILSPNSWGYRRTFDGYVEIDIQLSGGQDNTRAFVLPVGYRPFASYSVPSVNITPENAYAYIGANGDVIINFANDQPNIVAIRTRFSVVR